MPSSPLDDINRDCSAGLAADRKLAPNLLRLRAAHFARLQRAQHQRSSTRETESNAVRPRTNVGRIPQLPTQSDILYSPDS